MGEMSGKTALVTGSTSGIGLTIARALARQGASLVINGLGEAADIERIRRSIEVDYGVGCTYAPADMLVPAEIRAMVGDAVSRSGSVDILVNNAGIQHVAPIDEFPEDRFDAIIAINLVSSFHTIKAALPGMRAKGWGRIINVASAHALVASPYKSAYVAAKHGIAGLTKTVALEVATQGITVNAIAPGYVWTPLVEKQIPDQMKARGMTADEIKDKVLLAAQPTKAFVSMDEVAALATFLASGAAASITGAVIPIDGGWTAQ
jgi:3-hydroxybutyrate dehydrogenase